eukprot:SM000147S01130  [mRNA]  locus=s147:244986:246654:- [translate_table: standard]
MRTESRSVRLRPAGSGSHHGPCIRDARLLCSRSPPAGLRRPFRFQAAGNSESTPRDPVRRLCDRPRQRARRMAAEALRSANETQFQAACQALGPRGGHVVGVDVKKLVVPRHYCDGRVTVIRADAFELDSALLRELAPKGFSTVLSDMCPPLSGASASDIAASTALGQRALELALGSSGYIRALGATDTLLEAQDHHGVLNVGGSLVLKLLEGVGTQDFKSICRRAFGFVVWLRPKATRPASREIYLVAKGRR